MYAKRAELKVGILVILASLALLVLLFFATGGTFWGEWHEIQMRLQPGELSPRKGDPIFLNGVEVGTVTHVIFESEERRGAELTEEDQARLEADRRLGIQGPHDVLREVYVLIRAEVKGDTTLPLGTEGVIQESITGSRTLSLIPGHSLGNIDPASTMDAPIYVHQTPSIGGMMKSIGQLTEEAARTVSTATETLEEVKGLVVDVREDVRKGNIEQILADVREAAASLKRTLQGIEGDVQKITTPIVDAAGDVREVAAAARRLAQTLEKDLPEAVTDLRSLLASVKEVVDKAAPKVDVFLDDMNRTGRNLAALSEEFKGIGPEAKALLGELGRDADEMLELLIDTSRNLLDASEDLKAHPWKLMNEPEPDEIAFENLRSTMVNYVRAMQRMNSTSTNLRAILAKGDLASPTVRALLRRTLAEFERSVDRYRSSEARLMRLLGSDQAGAAPRRPGAPPPPPPPPQAR